MLNNYADGWSNEDNFLCKKIFIVLLLLLLLLLYYYHYYKFYYHYCLNCYYYRDIASTRALGVGTVFATKVEELWLAMNASLIWFEQGSVIYQCRLRFG